MRKSCTYQAKSIDPYQSKTNLGERAMLMRMIILAVEDYLGHERSGTAPYYFTSARDWLFFSDNPNSRCYKPELSFELCCTFLNLDVDDLRKRIREHFEAETSPHSVTSAFYTSTFSACG